MSRTAGCVLLGLKIHQENNVHRINQFFLHKLASQLKVNDTCEPTNYHSSIISSTPKRKLQQIFSTALLIYSQFCKAYFSLRQVISPFVKVTNTQFSITGFFLSLFDRLFYHASPQARYNMIV